jgi:hypothetical protein
VSNQDLARVRVGQVSDLGSDLSSELVITVVRVIVQDAILGFNVRYKGELALYNLRVLAEGLLIVILVIKNCFKLLLTQNKCASLVYANRSQTALFSQRISYVSYSCKPGGLSSRN